MNRTQLTEAYQKLKEDILAYIVPGFGEENDPSLIDAKSLRTIITEIEDVTGISRPMVEKTLRRYFQAEDYDPSSHGINYLAALWLINNKALTKEECRTFYKDTANRNSSKFWNEYLQHYLGNRVVEEPGPVPEEERDQVRFDDLSKLNEIFDEPETGFLIDRESCIQQLLDLINKQRLVVVDGISGAGKKSLVKTVQAKLQSTGRYRRIFWKYLGNYSLQDFLAELSERIDLPVSASYNKAQHFITYLKTNELLLVLYGIDNANHDSFKPFLENLAIGTSGAQLLIIRDNVEVFPFIASKNRITVGGFTDEEITAFCRLHKVYPPEDVVKQFRQQTDGLPYCLDLVVRAYKGKEEQNNNHSYDPDVERDIDYKINQWCSNLTEEDKTLLCVLSYHGNSFMERDWLMLARKIELENPRPHFDRLRSRHIIYLLNGVWHIVAPIAEYFRKKHHTKDNNKLHEIVADYISLASVPAIVSTLDKQQVKIQAIAVHHLQQASLFERSKKYLDAITPMLKQHNLYPVLYELLDYELNNNPKPDNWNEFHMAQTCLVLGKFDECYRHLKECIKVALRWHEDKVEMTTGKSFFLKTLQLFSELIAFTVSHDDAYKVLSGALSVFNPVELEWHLRGHALSVLSRHLEKKEDFERSKQINESLQQEFYAGTDQAKAIVSTHLGIANYNKGELKTAEQYFQNAKELFHKCCDERGEAWSSAYLVLTALKKNKSKYDTLIPTIIETHDSGQICDPDYIAWLETFAHKVHDTDLQVRIQSALKKATANWESTKQQTPYEAIRKELETILAYLETYTQNEFPFESFIDPITETKLSLTSTLQRSMVKEVKRKPEPYLAWLEELKPTEIFTSNQFNQIIIELLGIQEWQTKIMKKFVHPNLDLIKELPKDFDEFKIGYARRLHIANDQDKALELLGSVAEENHKFLYLTTKANCLRKKRDDKCDDYYELAGLAASSDTERGIHYHNLAIRIYEAGIKDKYAEAKEYCEKSIDFREDKFHFVKHVITTLVLLEIETAFVDDVITVVERLRRTYNIYNSWLQIIIREVKKGPKKRKLQTQFPGRSR